MVQSLIMCAVCQVGHLLGDVVDRQVAWMGEIKIAYRGLFRKLEILGHLGNLGVDGIRNE